MEAIILAGGFGTRLSHIVKDVPKPMAPVYGNPFLKYIVDDLIDKGITRIVMAVGHMQNIIIDYFGSSYRNIKIEYSSEDMPLLTGGAIKKALRICNEKSVFIINGDTFFDVDLNDMLNTHVDNNADITLALKYMENFERYGTVEFHNNKITSFEEKEPKDKGYINGGIYILRKNILELNLKDKFLLEEYIGSRIFELKLYAFFSEGYFIDIGIPEDYEKAQKDFKERLDQLGYISKYLQQN